MIAGAFEVLREARVPYRIISGADPDPAYRHWLAERLPQATTTVFPASGHFPHLSRPDEFARWLAATGDWPPVGGTDPSRRLLGLLAGYQRTQVLTAMVTLGVADELAAGRRPVSELAAVAGAQPQALERMLRAAASVGLVRLERGAGSRPPRWGGRCAAGRRTPFETRCSSTALTCTPSGATWPIVSAPASRRSNAPMGSPTGPIGAAIRRLAPGSTR